MKERWVFGVRGNKAKGLFLAVLVMACWGALFPLTKLSYAAFEIDTTSVASILLFAGARFFLCGIILCLFCLSTKKSLAIRSKSQGIRVVVVALFAVVLQYTFCYIGLTMCDSGKTALLKQIGSLFFISFSFLFFKEDRFSIFKVLGALLGICGVICLNMESLHFSLGLGEFLVFLSSLTPLVSNVAGKKLSKDMSGFAIAGESQLIGGAILLVIGFLMGGQFGTITVSSVLIFITILLTTCLGYGVWYHVIGTQNLSNLYIIRFLEAIFAGIIGAILLKENIFTWSYFFALLFTFSAILVSNIQKKQGEK